MPVPHRSGWLPGEGKPATRTRRQACSPVRPRAVIETLQSGARSNHKQHMSNATPDTRGAGGERRRRRSRGGKGRNRNRQNGNQSDNQNRQQGQRHPQRQERGPRPPRREPKPAPLTWWQKLLKLIGLYKEPVRPPRKQREERAPRLNVQETPVKSNTRVAKSADSGQRRNQERTEVASSRIYLGNLSYDTTEEDLKDLFKGVGTVRRVEIVYNRRTHKSKGYGFVDMLNVDEAKRAIEVLHDQFFMGRKLVVSGAKSKEYDAAQREDEEERKAPAAAGKPATEDTGISAAPEAAEITVIEESPVPSSSPEASAEATEPEPASEPVAEIPVAVPAGEPPQADTPTAIPTADEEAKS